MGAAAIRRFHVGVEAGDVNMNIAGLAMGNSWIHPVDSTINWGPLLYYMVSTYMFMYVVQKLCETIGDVTSKQIV